MRCASRGSPEDCRVACVVGGSVDGFTRGVVGMWRIKRAAWAVDAARARVESSNFIVWWW